MFSWRLSARDCVYVDKRDDTNSPSKSLSIQALVGKIWDALAGGGGGGDALKVAKDEEPAVRKLEVRLFAIFVFTGYL